MIKCLKIKLFLTIVQGSYSLAFNRTGVIIGLPRGSVGSLLGVVRSLLASEAAAMEVDVVLSQVWAIKSWLSGRVFPVSHGM